MSKWRDVREMIRGFLTRERITFLGVLNPFFIWSLLIRHRYTHFFLIGISGVAINLSVSWVGTELFFGKERYFQAYLIGVSANLVFNFVFHTIVTFQTEQKHVQRFFWFVIYSLTMTAFQAWLVKTVIAFVGVQFYLVVIASIILIFSGITFVLFKLILFRK